MMEEIIRHIGQLFMISFQGTEPSATFLNFINEENIGGVILFADNCENQQRIKKNIKLIHDNAKITPLIAIDQEGGRVSRIKGVPAEILAPFEYASHRGINRFADDYGRSLVFLESLGINVNLAPVADIFLNENNSCLKDRCFGTTAEEVIPFVTKAIELARQNGVLSCVKHFPGLGDTKIDPHVKTATADFDLIIWEQRERLPFKAAIDKGVDMVMTTHLNLPKIDDTIVTGSHKVVDSMLRGMLSFDGVVITDDLLMNGAEPLGDIGERTVAAFKAGHDILLFGQNLELAMQAFDYFREACHRGEITPEELSDSLDRVTGMKYKLNHSMII